MGSADAGACANGASGANGAASESSANMLAAAKRARVAAQKMAGLSEAQKNACLRRMREALVENRERILAENQKDVDAAERALASKVAASKVAAEAAKTEGSSGEPAAKKAKVDVKAQPGELSASMLARLRLKSFDSLLDGIDQIIQLPDPVGTCSYANQVTDGLDLYRVSCPIGVLCIIFEARPEAAVQIAALAVKSGNALLLKGGKEAAFSNKVLVDVMAKACVESLGPQLGGSADAEGVLQLVEAREEISALLKMDQHIDLVIPRGGNALVSYIKRNTLIPVLGHADGICAVYVDQHAKTDMAVRFLWDFERDLWKQF